LVVDEVVHISGERKDVVVLMDSVGINLTALGLGVVVPVKIPGVAGTYSIPEDKERKCCPPKGDPDVTGSEDLIPSLLESINCLWILQRWHVWSVWPITSCIYFASLIEVPLESLFPLCN
tara:strand:- start:174 stop:533 length:360 start_codon:yes stop_codon:yes gene_type:complete